VDAELLGLALAASIWPILLAVTLIALRAPHPGRLLGAFLAGGLLTTITIGFVIIYAVNGSVDSQSTTFDPIVYIAAGALVLLAAFVMARRYEPPPPEIPREKSASTKRIEEMLDRGTAMAFVAGIVLDLFPSPFALIAFKDIAQADYSVAGTFAVLLAFFLVVFVLIEIPLIGFVAMPERTTGWTVRFNAWFGQNWHRLCVWGLTAGGFYLIGKGVYLYAT
jgi:hypothetical protein